MTSKRFSRQIRAGSSVVVTPALQPIISDKSAGGQGFKSPPVHHILVLEQPVLKVRQTEYGMESSCATVSAENSHARSKYSYLLETVEELRRWSDNILQGSKVATKKNLRRFGHICKSKQISPKQMVKLAKTDERWSYNFLIDLLMEMTGAGYAGSIKDSKKVVEGWLKHSGLELIRKIKIKGSESTLTLNDRGQSTKQSFDRSSPVRFPRCDLVSLDSVRSSPRIHGR